LVATCHHGEEGDTGRAVRIQDRGEVEAEGEEEEGGGRRDKDSSK